MPGGVDGVLWLVIMVLVCFDTLAIPVLPKLERISRRRVHLRTPRLATKSVEKP